MDVNVQFRTLAPRSGLDVVAQKRNPSVTGNQTEVVLLAPSFFTDRTIWLPYSLFNYSRLASIYST